MKTNTYKELKMKHEKEVNDFPMAFSFSDAQFEEGMKKLGLNPTDVNLVCRIGKTGGFCRVSDAKSYQEMVHRHALEVKSAIERDETGERFIFDMFRYELNNHEYGYTMDSSDTLKKLGYTLDEINNNPILSNGFKKACSQIENAN